jgi:phosphocarrier protein
MASSERNAANSESDHMSGQADDNLKVTREFRVANRLGIHSRPASKFVRTARRFGCDIRVEGNGRTVNGRSLLGLILLSIGHGATVRVHACGHDAVEAMAELECLIRRNFGEE